MNKNIDKALKKFTEKFMLSGRFPEVIGTAKDEIGIVLYLAKESKTTVFPSKFDGFPVKAIITGQVKAQGDK